MFTFMIFCFISNLIWLWCLLPFYLFLYIMDHIIEVMRIFEIFHCVEFYIITILLNLLSLFIMSLVYLNEIYYSYKMRMIYFNLKKILVKRGIYILIFSPIILKIAIISRLVPQSQFYFMLLIWVSKSPLQRFSYKFFFLIKKAQISFLITSVEYCPLNIELFNLWKKSISVHWLGMIWNISVSEVKFLILSSC